MTHTADIDPHKVAQHMGWTYQPPTRPTVPGHYVRPDGTTIPRHHAEDRGIVTGDEMIEFLLTRHGRIELAVVDGSVAVTAGGEQLAAVNATAEDPIRVALGTAVLATPR